MGKGGIAQQEDGQKEPEDNIEVAHEGQAG